MKSRVIVTVLPSLSSKLSLYRGQLTDSNNTLRSPKNLIDQCKDMDAAIGVSGIHSLSICLIINNINFVSMAVPLAKKKKYE